MEDRQHRSHEMFLSLKDFGASHRDCGHPRMATIADRFEFGVGLDKFLSKFERTSR